MKKGSEMENFIHFIYSSLIRIKDYNTVVSKRTCIIGRNGTSNEFDVYYEFHHLNIRYRVAIECKDWAGPVTIKEVRDFWAKLSELDNIAGVMVTKSGYQSGAEKFAKDKGIMLLGIEDLPTFNEIVAMQVKKAFLPGQEVIGEPFWTLMEYIDEEVTGTYICIANQFTKDNKKIIPLFYSKRIASEFCSRCNSKGSVVRGINQWQLKGLLSFAENYNIGFAICPLTPNGKNDWPFYSITKNELEKDFLLMD